MSHTKTMSLVLSNSAIFSRARSSESFEFEELKNTIPYTLIPYLSKHDIAQFYGKSDDDILALATPTPAEYMAKTAFWKAYSVAARSGRRMVMKDFLTGIMSTTLFKRMWQSPAKLTWLLTPVQTYESKVESYLDRIADRYEELLSMDITHTKKLKVNGEEKLITETDAKKAMVLLNVIKNLEERVKGSAVQKQISIKTTAPSDSEMDDVKLDMDTVNKRIAELEEKLGENSMPVIDVTGV